MYKAFIRYELPEAILSDRKPQTKGKIEGLFRFVKRDFVLENVHLTAIKEVNCDSLDVAKCDN
jgi:transposase